MTPVLIENVTHHIDEGEQDWFPRVRDGLGRKQLQELGEDAGDAGQGTAQPGRAVGVEKAVDAVIAWAVRADPGRERLPGATEEDARLR